MRIAMISYHTCPLATLGGKDTGGMNVYVREISKQLGRIGISVDVFTRSQDEHVPHVVHDLGFGNRVIHVPAGPEVPLPKKDLSEHIPKFVENILTFVDEKSLRYDVIHSHYWMSGIAARDLKAAWDIPIVHMFHTLGLMKNRIAGEGEFEGDYRIKGEREVLRHADKVTAATRAELAQLQWLYEVKTDNVVIIPPGVDTGRFYPIPMEDAREYLSVSTCPRMLLFVGRIEPLKGVGTLIEAISEMREDGFLDDAEVCLVIIGGDASVSEELMSHEMARLLNLREKYGLQDVVTFLGKRSQDTLPNYYSAADVVVVPSHYESFGMVALEAMACGTPVVASQVGGLAYLIKDGETGYHVRNQEPGELADRLMRVLQDDDLHASMSENAAAYAKNYSWKTIAEQVMGLYDELIQ
ncbi:MAG TPA: glycosyltransferase [Anaerolineales bacterium]|nr:glycosyltransferase [Anaerolineales bacterium]